MFHIILHVLVPLFVAFIFYRLRWKLVSVVLIATMIVDLDHLLAYPIYDPARCSIGFHPLHTLWPILFYILMFTIPIYLNRKKLNEKEKKWNYWIHIMGLGLLIHMILDGLDCWF